MSRPPRLKTDQVVELAARPEGVNSHQVQQLFSCDANAAGALLLRAVVHHGLVRERAPGSRYHYFTSTQLAQQWLARQVARAGAAVRAAQRLVDDVHERALQAKAARDARRAEAARVQARAQELQAELQALRARHGGRLPRKAAPLKAGPAAATAAPQAPAARQLPAQMSPRVIHTVHQAKPPADRVNIMADPLPTVPGWRAGPYIRPGALDFKAHQRHGGQGV